MTALGAVPGKVRMGDMMDAFTTYGNEEGSAPGQVLEADLGTYACIILGDPRVGPARYAEKVETDLTGARP